MEHSLHIFLHIILFGLWLGSAVILLLLLLRLYLTDIETTEERLQLQTFAYVQRVPKAVLILMLPMGLQLSSNLGFISMGGGSMTGVWIFAIIWLLIDWKGAPSGLSESSKAMRMVERVLQATFIVLLAGTGVLSLLSGNPVEASWLATKMILFAFTLVIMSSVDVLLTPVYAGVSGTDRKQPILIAAGLLAVLIILLLVAAWTGFNRYGA